MPAISDGLIEITLTTVFNNTEAQNVFHYAKAGGGVIQSVEDVLVAFDAKIFPDLANLLGTGVSFTDISGRDVFGLKPDANITPTSPAGTRAGELSNNFSAFRINLNVSTKETRRGYKRFGGMVEADFAGNGLSTAFRTDVQAFALLLNDGLSATGDVYGPTIYGRPTPTQPTRHVENTITSTTVPNRQVSQLSRKR